LVPEAVTRAVLAEEFPPAEAWAARHGWELSANLDGLRLQARTVHPLDGEPLLIIATFDGYRAVPPAWKLVDPETGETTNHSFPQPGPVGPGLSSIFHGSLVICAPWNLLAYSDHGGPHANWNGPSNWLNVNEGNRAVNIAEMLSTINVHLRTSPGRMG